MNNFNVSGKKLNNFTFLVFSVGDLVLLIVFLITTHQNLLNLPPFADEKFKIVHSIIFTIDLLSLRLWLFLSVYYHIKRSRLYQTCKSVWYLALIDLYTLFIDRAWLWPFKAWFGSGSIILMLWLLMIWHCIIEGRKGLRKDKLSWLFIF